VTSKPLIIRDEIHGDISLGPVIRAVVDHASFQRLRYIKQLGLAEYVFPCATHTRFQHSMGAAYLGRQYFESLVETWPEWEFDYKGKVGGTEFLVDETRACVVSVAEHAHSREFWGDVAALAGLLHDVGHGPWSHTFEYLDLPQNFDDRIGLLNGSVRSYFDKGAQAKQHIMHEDVSVLYVHRILRDLEESNQVPGATRFFLPVSLLINKRMLAGELRMQVRTELDALLHKHGVRGGLSMLRLMSPLISGPFDVDRADYIQRDGRNCGVPLGGIEWRRIVRKVMPCLAIHANDRGEPTDVVLVSNLKNQHVLDDFIFSLFQMYAQVYLHPKIVAFEDQVRRELDEKVPKMGKPTVTFQVHEGLSDEAFRIWLEKEFGAMEIRKTLFRQHGYRFQVLGLPDGRGQEAGLQHEGYRCVPTQDRPMLKDAAGVFLFSPGGSGKGGQSVVLPWKMASPIAEVFHSINHSSEIWIRPEP
jgi:HD superfamily phosphohydrolase